MLCYRCVHEGPGVRVTRKALGMFDKTLMVIGPSYEELKSELGDFPVGPRRREMSRLWSRPAPRGAAHPTRTAYRIFNLDDPKTAYGRPGPKPHALPVLQSLALP
jgi:hypothetical protein